METAHGGGGAINIITKQQKESAASLSFRENLFQGGNHGQNLNAAFSHQITANTAFSLNINGFNEQGYRDGDKDKGFFVNSKFYYDINDRNNINIGFNYFQNKHFTTGYLTKEQAENNPRQKGDADIETKITRPEFSFDYNSKIGDNFEFNTLAFWQKQKIDYVKNEQPYTMGTTTTMAYQTGSGFEDRLTGLNLKGKYNYLESSYLTFGYEFRKHDMDRTAITYYGFNMGPIAQRHTMTTLLDMKKQSHSVYALDSHSFNDKFSISGGARYEYANYKGDRSYNSDWLLNMGTAFADRYYTNKLDNRHTNNFALEITPNFSYSDTGRVYVKYERGFISPTPAQFVNRRNDLPAGQNPYEINHLDSETFDTFEIGTRDFLWDFYEYNFTLFYTQTSDEITYFGDPHALDGGTGNINGFWRYLNIDETRRYGAELSLNQYFLDDTLILSQSFSYVDAKISKGINDGRLIPYVSKFKATAGLDYAWTPNFKTFIDLSYLSRAKDGGLPDATTGKMSGSKWTKEQFITDIGANYTYKNLSIFGGIKNLFDYKYYNYQGPIENAGVRTGTRVAPADGRSYYVELKYKF